MQATASGRALLPDPGRAAGLAASTPRAILALHQYRSLGGAAAASAPRCAGWAGRLSTAGRPA